MISTRYGRVSGIVLALALVPTIIHNYVGAAATDGLTTEAISTTLGEFASKPTARRAGWVKETYDSDDWIERIYTAATGESALLFVARSYDMKRLYHHPEIGVLHTVSFSGKHVVRLPGMNNAPVHVLQTQTGRGSAAYALLYDGAWVEDPIALQLGTSLKLLVGPRKPTTIFLVYDKNSPLGSASFEGSPAEKILRDAVVSFLAQNPSNKAAGGTN